MNGAVQYILTVTAAALLVSVLRSLSDRGGAQPLIRLITGVFLALTVISPLLKLELPDVEGWFSVYVADGEAAAAAGEELSADAVRAIIIQRTRAYILDKAAELGAELEVEVALDDAGIPVGVSISGQVSPYAKTRLARIIESELGIGEEAQQWTG